MSTPLCLQSHSFTSHALAQLRYNFRNGILVVQNCFDVAVQYTHTLRCCCGNVRTKLSPGLGCPATIRSAPRLESNLRPAPYLMQLPRLS